jgi:putative methionine-R-sulfoxide reductase with GAF domain
VSTRALTALDRILNVGSDADDVLREVVAELVTEPTIEWAGILFLEAGALALGPEAGVADPTRRIGVPVSYQGTVVGELAIDGDADVVFLERVAQLISTHVLLGWDTGGEAWEP